MALISCDTLKSLITNSTNGMIKVEDIINLSDNEAGFIHEAVEYLKKVKYSWVNNQYFIDHEDKQNIKNFLRHLLVNGEVQPFTFINISRPCIGLIISNKFVITSYTINNDLILCSNTDPKHITTTDHTLFTHANCCNIQLTNNKPYLDYSHMFHNYIYPCLYKLSFKLGRNYLDNKLFGYDIIKKYDDKTGKRSNSIRVEEITRALAFQIEVLRKELLELKKIVNPDKDSTNKVTNI